MVSTWVNTTKKDGLWSDREDYCLRAFKAQRARFIPLPYNT
nr:MAG TPA: hypothetical protein [Caudoviricetes sp.]